jgi:hypothetical protein
VSAHEAALTREEQAIRQQLLNAWREARRANLSFPLGRAMPQEQMDEQQRLNAEQDKARQALEEFDAAHGLAAR